MCHANYDVNLITLLSHIIYVIEPRASCSVMIWLSQWQLFYNVKFNHFAWLISFMVLMLFIYLGGRPALRCSPSSFDILIKPAMVNAIAIKRQTYLCQSFIHTIKWSLTLVDEILLLDKSLVKNYCHRFVNIDHMRARRICDVILSFKCTPLTWAVLLKFWSWKS